MSTAITTAYPQTRLGRQKRFWSSPAFAKLPWVAGQVGAVALGLVLWQIASLSKFHAGLIDFSNVPSPVQVAIAFTHAIADPRVGRNVLASLLRIADGFLAAAVLGVVLGLLIGYYPKPGSIISAPLELLRPIPAVAWVPLATLMFTNAEASMAYITFIGAFFPILLSTTHGVKSVDQRLILSARCLGAKGFTIFREAVFPGAIPAIVNGLSIGMGNAWFSLVTAEMISGRYGVGYFTWESYNLQNYPEIVLGMAVIGVLGMLTSSIIRVGGRLATPWETR